MSGVGENEGDVFNFSLPATYLSSPDRKQLFFLATHTVLHMSVWKTSGILVTENRTMSIRVEMALVVAGLWLFSWFPCWSFVRCHLQRCQRKPPLWNFVKLGAVIEPHHILNTQPMTFKIPAGGQFLIELYCYRASKIGKLLHVRFPFETSKRISIERYSECQANKYLHPGIIAGAEIPSRSCSARSAEWETSSSDLQHVSFY